jgi:energy-coupling factor transporter ATP-binding protein EcfA2
MEFVRARVTNFKSIDDSGWVSIDGITCLVGKNESGKTAFLQALRKLNPVMDANGDFDLKDYPRKGYARYKRVHPTQPANAVSAEFSLSEEEAAGIADLASPRVVVHKDYSNHFTWEIEFNHPSPEAAVRRNVEDRLERLMPHFVYFDNYSTMRGRISIENLLERRNGGNGGLDDADRTFLSLLSVAGTDIEELRMQNNYEHLKAELESAAIGISDELFEFWQQNKQLRVDFDLSLANPNDPPPLNSGTILHTRIWNDRHRVSVPFDERSRGFVWFFSFLTYFSNLEEERTNDLVLLLDEPGTNLHAMGQTDFLRFIKERLAAKHQVIYSTHSPFMVDLESLDSVRLVEDLNDTGTVVSDDVLSNDSETVFPLQVALGYRMAQRLFLAPHVLMVNSPSDTIYLQVLGDVVASNRGSRLDPRWVLIPVGAAENVPTFVSLLSEDHTTVAVLMDVTPTKKERVEELTMDGKSDRTNPIRWVEVTRVRDADIEDLFEPDFYLKLVNRAYDGVLPSDLTRSSISDSNPRIAERVATYFERHGIDGGEFDRNRPAAYLLGKHSQLRDDIDEATIERASALFNRVNALLPLNGPMNGASTHSIGFQRTRAVA